MIPNQPNKIIYFWMKVRGHKSSIFGIWTYLSTAYMYLLWSQGVQEVPQQLLTVLLLEAAESRSSREDRDEMVAEMCVCTHVTHVCVYIHTCVSEHVWVCVCVRTCDACLYMCTYIHTCVNEHVCLCYFSKVFTFQLRFSYSMQSPSS